MTRLFSRKDKTTIAELEEYYSATGKKNRGLMAWVMALFSIILTILLVLALFFFGRWVYRSVVDDNDSSTVVTETEGESVDLPSFDGDTTGQENQEGSESTVPEQGGVVSDEAATVTVDDGQSSSSSVSGSSTSAADDSSTNSNSTGEEGTDIPDTGAGEIIVLIPIIAGATGYFISRRYQLKNN